MRGQGVGLQARLSCPARLEGLRRDSERERFSVGTEEMISDGVLVNTKERSSVGEKERKISVSVSVGEKERFSVGEKERISAGAEERVLVHAEERVSGDAEKRRMTDIADGDSMVEVEYESKEEATGRIPLPASEEGRILRDRNRRMRITAALLSMAQPSPQTHTMTELRPIIQFRPIDMIGMDYIGPISPACEMTGFKYICLCIDYYSRFLFAREFAQHRELETMDFLLNNIAPVAGWPTTLYTDNGSHFVGHCVTELLKSFGVLHLTAPVPHPSSVGLIERYV